MNLVVNAQSAFFLIVLVLGVCCNMVFGAPVQSLLQATSYLTQFGYMDSSTNSNGLKSSSLIAEATVKQAISDFQRFAGLPVTGELDNATVVLMNMPRCGVKDIVGKSTRAKRKRRYALQGSRWRVKDLSFRVSKYPTKLTAEQTDDEVTRAFKVWSEVADLRFTHKKSSDRAHIDVRFERGEHGDGDPFDGRGGTLAHAYFPIYGGDVHFDDAEQWTVNTYKGTNLRQVAAHEFGHSLGLSHSDVRESLMAPFYRGFEPHIKLHKDDIQAIQSLYGELKTDAKENAVSKSGRSTTVTPSNSVDSTHEDGELCSDPKIDTIFRSSDKDTYAFKGEHYWKLTDDGIADGYPRTISKDWDGLPSRIDAAFTWNNGKTYFFKNNKYWRYTNKRKDDGYPKLISVGFEGIPDNVNAVFVWSGNGKIYFFKDSMYYRYDHDREPPVSKDYPRKISNWEGIPNNIDAAFQWSNGYTYFFKGTSYWRFNDREFTIDQGSPPFPRPSANWWFGCKSMSAAVHKAESDDVVLLSQFDSLQDGAQFLDDSALSEAQLIATNQALAQQPSKNSAFVLSRPSLLASVTVLCSLVLAVLVR